jgi:hypothetical protein
MADYLFWDALPTLHILERMDRDEQTDRGSRSKATNGPQVIVNFSGYEPPFDVSSTVQHLLDSVPKKYLAGLSAVVLTDTGALSRKRRNSTVKARQRKMRLNAAAGLYHATAKGNPAWIEIFVDNTVRGWEKTLWLHVPYFRESKLADVLFHEIGHHIHCTVAPEHREKEDVADVWKVRLQRNYHKQRFGWIRIVFRIIQPVLGSFLERQREKLELKMLKSGQISRAEYRESNRKSQSGDTPAKR